MIGYQFKNNGNTDRFDELDIHNAGGHFYVLLDQMPALL